MSDDDAVEKLAGRWPEARSVVVLTAAVLSTASGIPAVRDAVLRR